MSALSHLAGLIRAAAGARRGERPARLLAQYHRAALLPDIGVRVWHNDAQRRPVDVSVLISSHNYADHLGSCLDSVFASQPGPLQFEVIVVDDCSADTSLTLLRDRLATSPWPMQVIATWWNVGVSRVRNLALRRASGAFVFILDADNRIVPEALARLHARITEEGAAAAYGPIERALADGTPQGTVSDRPFDPAFLAGHGNYIDAMALFRRADLLDIGGYDLELLRIIGGWEDYFVWLELAARGRRVAFDPGPVGRYLVKPDSMVNRITEAEYASALRLIHARYASLRDAG